MTNCSRKIPFKKAGKSDRSDRLRIEKERFARDLDTAVIRLAHVPQQRSNLQNNPWPPVAYWQTAIVKIVRWFLNPQGLQFDPWLYIKQEETETIKLMCDVRSQWMTRKQTAEKILEFVAVDEDSLKIIPTDMSVMDGVIVTKSGQRIKVLDQDSFHVGKIAGSSIGIMYLKEESVPIRQVCNLLVRIKDRFRSESNDGSPNE